MQYSGSNNVEGVSESWSEAEMSWVEVGGDWNEQGGGGWSWWRWVQGLVIPIINAIVGRTDFGR